MNEQLIITAEHSLLQSTALCEILQIDIAQDLNQQNSRRIAVADILKQKIQCAIDTLEQYQKQSQR